MHTLKMFLGLKVFFLYYDLKLMPDMPNINNVFKLCQNNGYFIHNNGRNLFRGEESP
jgi:hypothetical protein